MKKLLTISIILLSLFLFSCKKEELNQPPMVQLQEIQGKSVKAGPLCELYIAASNVSTCPEQLVSYSGTIQYQATITTVRSMVGIKFTAKLTGWKVNNFTAFGATIALETIVVPFTGIKSFDVNMPIYIKDGSNRLKMPGSRINLHVVVLPTMDVSLDNATFSFGCY